ncbi:NUDIX domain-containing protein [Aeromonas veronii bv. sobria]|uniref:DNA mismatch repair protein MutT n=1 Tax=Aeromonas veronii TaxID=654 RepID=A0ABY3MKD1_AERVE|nr:NUDIX domain-containing protein [Aeromonas veronii]RDU84706.1 DNA mismatch repair protein MutT [Aeromonas veronii]RDU84763.1 DNA mismatch repair protein MutT [Aeromonas veronii]TEY51945.1 DNA mismatch repair protein MutT [Aeromonas veronii]TEY70179.1 DNA mismatch repair protein MutT [Aeromonas veronii]TYD42892.1 DNA mismatch repair protein MutT [Aeromonas veronii]
MFCPKCGGQTLQSVSPKEFRCGCGFHFFQNVATAVMVALCWQDEVLVAVRACNPGKGLLDLPGGFVDPGESLEGALVRELQEELGLDVSAQPFTYLGSFPNIYPYDGIAYHTCDTFFAIRLSEKPVIQPADDVAACQWLKISDIPLSRFAFESTRTAMARLQQSSLQA